MGNWRTVNIIGTVSESEVDNLRQACTYNKQDYSNFHCLSMSNGLCGLGHWVSTTINAQGNLADKGYSIEDVTEQLKELVKVAPSLKLKVHCGGDYESEDVLATITVEEKKVSIGKPEVAKISGATERDMTERLFNQLFER